MGLDPVTIGRYRILGTLGEGAMGVVYLAEDPLLKRGVAIKVVQGGGLTRRDALRRFQREAEISARLNHPNIVTVFDVGEEPGVGPFIAMEHIEGESLAARLRHGPLPSEEAILLLAQLRAALEIAHRADIVHRDVKPENILLTSEGRLKLMDFGLAKDEDSGVTATAVYMGTPAYAAPELLAGQRASAATDTWAFAVTAFECLLGAAPFAGATISATLFLIAHEAPRFPEGMAPRLRQLFERAFQKDPALRTLDLGTFMAELVAALPLEGEAKVRARMIMEGSGSITGSVPALQVALPSIESLEDQNSRHRWIWPVLGAILLLGLGAWIWTIRSPRILTVSSDPPGALVMADGKPLGETPLKNFRVAAGVRHLRLEKPGYFPLDHQLTAGEHELDLHLKAAPFRIRVTSEPSGASVFLDGIPQGETPLENLEIPGEGSHTLKAEKAGYLPWVTQPRRDRVLPDPIPLQKLAQRKALPSKEKPEEPSKVKKFFSNLFKKKG